MSAPNSSPSSSSSISSSSRFFIITRHARTIELFTKLGGVSVSDISQIPNNSIAIGVLPVDLVASLTKRGIRFINVSIDPRKFSERFGVQYNPKDADRYIAQISDDEFVRLLRFLLYEDVKVSEISVSDVINEIKQRNVTSIYYNGSPQFAEGLSKLFGLPVTSRLNNNSIAFSPVENGTYYMLRVMDRNIIINNSDEFVDYISKGVIKIFRVKSVVREITWNDVLSILGINIGDENLDPKTITKEL